MPNMNFEATPTLVAGKVSWKLCYLPQGKPKDCGNAKSPFPDVVLGYNQGAYWFKYKIVGDQTGLGIKFSSDPIWIANGTQPTGPGIDSQIDNVSVTPQGELKFRDKNDKPDEYDGDPVILKYQLNFVDKDENAVTSLDPDITNGGTGNTLDFADYLLPVGAGLLAGMALMFLYRRFFGEGAAVRK